MFVIRLKGLKKAFSKDPIDYQKIRKGDVREPKGAFFKQDRVKNFQVLNTFATEVNQENPSKNLLLFIHGGAFISGPSQIHWDTLKEIVKQTDHAVWLCDYPKAPETKIQAISENIDAVYQAALEKYPANRITLLGDSVGGTLVTALVQRLVQQNIELPLEIILVSPVMDASMSNPQIDKVDLKDPMLSKVGVLSAKRMCAENNDLENPMISPLNGNFKGFPKTTLFIAENDITYPDQLLAIDKMTQSEVELEVVDGKNMPHIWPFLPVMKEAKLALKEIIKRLNS